MDIKMTKSWETRRKRVFEIIEVGSDFDIFSRGYDWLNVAAILLNLSASILYTFDSVRLAYNPVLVLIENITVIFFFIDYILRIWTAKYLYQNLTQKKAVKKYILSFTGIVDLFSFMPYYLPFFFPAGAIAFRLLRIARIFRLFRINKYYDSLNVITEVLVNKKQQLISSVFIILVLMVAARLCMYSLEHNAQPEVFSNAFTGIWWAASTLLTVGYGDIYPVTSLGKLFGIMITFLGVGMVAIPTGIISAGFVDQYSRIKRINEYGLEDDIRFIRIELKSNDKWVGSTIGQIHLPEKVIAALIQREGKPIVPHKDTVLKKGDILILGAENFRNKELITLKELQLKTSQPWIGKRIDELHISRQSIIVLIKRRNRVLIPNDDWILHANDTVILYTQSQLNSLDEIQI